jgi:ketosteroid isomerase-like protein
MPSPTLLPSFFALAGLVCGATHAAPVPPLDVAEAQLRAVNHRSLDLSADGHAALADALTGEDFLLTDSDGAWRTRAQFLDRLRQPSLHEGYVHEDLRVRLFGRVAVMHGVVGVARAGGATARARYTDVHVWAGAAWRLVSVQNTPMKDAVTVQARTGVAPAHAPWLGQDPSGDELAVLSALNEHYVQAFREADVAWYDTHLAPDYVVVSGDGSMQDRAAALVDFAKPVFATSIQSFPVDKVSIRRFDDVALIHAENAYELKDGRRGVSRYTDIWHKHSGQWRCIAAHITVLAAPSNS